MDKISREFAQDFQRLIAEMEIDDVRDMLEHMLNDNKIERATVYTEPRRHSSGLYYKTMRLHFEPVRYRLIIDQKE